MLASGPAASGPSRSSDANPLEQCGRGLVAAAFTARELGFGGYQLAAEGFREDGLRELVGTSRRGRDAGVDGVSKFEESTDAANDLELLGQGRQRDRSRSELIEAKVRPAFAVNPLLEQATSMGG